MTLAYVALAWGAGLWAANESPIILPFTWVLFAAGGCGGWYFTRDMARWRLGFALLAIFGFGAARIAVTPRTSEIAGLNGSGGVTVTGLIAAPPNVRDTSTQVRIEVDSVVLVGQPQPIRGLVLAQLPPTTRVSYGDRVAVTGRLRAPEEGDTFDYATFLARRGIFSLLDRVSGVDVISQGHGNSLVALSVEVRDWVFERISTLLPEPHAGILTAILTGDERSISPAVANAYSLSGIAHLLAVSGFNMALVGGVALHGLRTSTSRPWLWLVVGLLLLAGYTLLVGFTPSATRAAVMAAVVMVGSMLRRRAYLPISLSFAFLILTVLDPAAVFDLGFQLSFAAVLGIAVISPPLTKRLTSLLQPEFPHPVPRAVTAVLAEALVITVAASALTMPIIGMAFGRLPLISLVTNLLVVPLQPLVMTLGIGALLLSSIPIAAQAVAWLCLVPLSWTTTVARTMAQVPVEISLNLHPIVVGSGFGGVIAFSMIQATRPPWWDRVVSRRVVLTAIAGAAFVGVLALGVLLSQPDGKLHVWILDAGHSNAVLVQTPSGAQILIDGGRYPSRLLTLIGDILPFNDTELDAVVFTQPDPFDMGAVASVLKRYQVGAVYSNGQLNLGAEVAEIASLADVVPLIAGQTLDSGDGVVVEVLNPQTAPDIEDALDDVALVLKIRYGDASFLIGGEASADAQSRLLEAGSWPLAWVLVLPKHGASLNSDFLDAVQPSAIVIQTDRANLLGDPDPDVIDMLPDAPLWRTDQHGTIHFTTDGVELYVSTER